MKIVINTDVRILNGNNTEPNDDFVVEKDNICFGLSGIILKNVSAIDEIQRYIINGSVQKQYKGTYVAWLYDKKNKKIYVANDLLSKQSVYFYDKDGLILINTSLFDLCTDLRANGRTPNINMEAIRFFCDNNVFCGDMTYESNTYFLTAYSYIVIDCEKKRLEVKRLSIPKMKKSDEITEIEAIEKMEKLFAEACEIQWRKNEQFGKDQIFTISGGMDSRAVLLHMIHNKGNASVKTYTYAQSGSADDIIAKRLAKELKINNIFIPLDNCEFAYQRDEIIEANEGQMYYVGSTGAILLARMLCKEATGIVHTGLGGGEIFGDICSAEGDAIMDQSTGLTMNQQNNLDDIRRCLNFQKTTAHYFCASSPFLDEDFFEYVMCLPISMRIHRKLYIKWYKDCMGSKFPTATSHSMLLKAINKIKIKVYRTIRKRNPMDMNPIQYWYDSQPQLREYIDSTWKNDCKLLSKQIDLLEILTKNFNDNDLRKFTVLTVTGSVMKILGITD